jgi:cytochrome oxidase Cu insertion factor (SCO1/SenC/PrrC family)
MPIHQEAPRPATSRRTAWVIVIIMSVLLVLALLGTIWGFVRQAHVVMAARASRAAPAVPVPAAASAAATITLAPGARIVSATADAGKLVLHVEAPTGGEVEIIDLASGKLTGQVKTAPL